MRRELLAGIMRRQRAAMRIQAWGRVVVIGPRRAHAEAQRVAAASRRERRDAAARLLQIAVRKRWGGRKGATKRARRAHAPRPVTRRAAGAKGMDFVSSFGVPQHQRNTGVTARLSDTCGSSETLARRRVEVSALEYELHRARLEVRKTAAAAC